MNARTIQHPGVQMRQIDMSEYRDAIVVNNAYIMGFADKGPIYDYSWITTQSQFIKLYGKPQTEAEKYLYYAVTSVLNNGGTPVVARMPYDNKQCKSYKGLAIRYSGITDDNQAGEVRNADNIKIYGWKDKPQVEKDYYPDYMGQEGVLPKFGTNAIPLSADVVVSLDKLSTVLGSEEDEATTLGKVAKYLTKNGRPVADTKTVEDVLNVFRGYEKDEEAIELYSGLISTINAVDTDKLNTFINSNYSPDNENFSELSNKINEIFDYIDIEIENPEIKAELTGFTISDYAINKVVYYISGVEANVNSLATGTNIDIELLSDSLDKFKLTKKYEYSNEIVYLENNYTTYSSLAIKNISAQITQYDVSEVTEDNKQFISGSFADTILVAKDETAIRRDVINRFLQLKEFVNSKSFVNNLINNDYKFNDVALSTVNIPLSSIQGFYDNLKRNSDTTALLSTTLEDVSKMTEDNTPSAIYDNALRFAKIFNSPSFYDTESLYDEEGYHEATQALIDSKVITKSKLGYNNIIMLDSKEITISNDQYDDLVTAQKFTDGDNITNPDCKNDINRRFRSDIRSANFMIVDKHKSIAAGEGSNEGIFTVLIDPYDGMKAQRLLYHNYSEEELQNNYDPKTLDYYLQQNDIDWKQRVIDEIESMNILQHVYNADELLVGEQKSGARFKNLMDTWSTPLTGGFYADSISKNLGRLYPQIAMADIKPGQSADATSVEKTYSSYVVVAVCRTLVDPANGRITIAVVESFFGSLFDEKDPATGTSQYIGNIINEQSDYIEFYRNDFVKNPYSDDAFAVRVPQVYMRNSQELKQAADIAGIDLALYDTNDVYDNLLDSDEFTADIHGKYYFNWKAWKDLYTKIVLNNCDTLRYAKYDFLYFGERLANLIGKTNFELPADGTPEDEEYERKYKDYFEIAESKRFGDAGLDIVPQDFTKGFELYSYSKLIKDLNHKANIFIFDKTDTCLYNNHPVGHFSSFSRKDSQKVIANTTGLAGEKQQAVSNVAKNFLVDMDRCIKFIQNVDEVSIYFVVDAGISTIAQYCDNIVWDYYKKDKAFEPIKGGWITQGYDPDHDQDAEDRVIKSLEDISTWRAVIGKLDQISKEIRKDCMTIIDAPRQLTLEGAAPKIRRSKPTNDWKNVVGDKLRWISGINSSYSAGYYNWLRVTDTFTGRAFWLPPTCKVIGNYMYLNIQNLPWLAPAGFQYGVVTGIHGVSHNPSYKQEDEIYLKSWNYIKQYPYEGFIIEGQKTTLTKNSAFNRVNVRTLFLDLERYVYNMSKTFKYTVNNQYTRQQYVQTLATKFNDYKARGGIYDYKIVCDTTNNTPQTIDANELRASIYIKPARLIEFILVDFICTKTGTNFEEII